MAGGRLRLLLGPRGISGAVTPVMNFVREAVAPRVAITVDALANFITGTSDGTPIPIDGIPGEVPFGLSERNGFFSYGQSLSIGRFSQPALTTTSLTPLSLTFGSGPKSSPPGNTYGGLNTSPGTSTSISLKEDDLDQFAAGNCGETICSIAIKTVTDLAEDNDGILPADNLWYASAPGKGAQTIATLGQNGAWWVLFTSHLDEQYARSNGDLGETYAARINAFQQGEADAQDGTTYQVYYDELVDNIALAANTYAMNKTGQLIPLFTQIDQTPHDIIANAGQVALAQYDAAQDCSIIDYVAPNWPWPRYSDGLHLTNVGEDVGGYYFGRAAYQRVVLGTKPDYLKPISASWSGGTLRVTFDVPTLPLVLDPLIGAGATGAATQNGFRLVDSDGDNALSDFAVDGNALTATTAREPNGAATIRCGLDYLGSGLNVDGGASCNLRDSTPTTITISGTTYPTYHVAPHFQMTVNY